MPRSHLHPVHPSLASTTVLCSLSLSLHPARILSQTQSGAPLRAKSEDMIARECLVFYKIGYPQLGDPEGERTTKLLPVLNSTPAAAPHLIQLRAFRSCFGTFPKNTVQFIENFMFIQTTMGTARVNTRARC